MSDDPYTFLAEPTPAWWPKAACRGLDPGLFVLERGETATQAKAVCAGCAVRTDCLEYALAQGDKRAIGIYGGTSQKQRRQIHHERSAA